VVGVIVAWVRGWVLVAGGGGEKDKQLKGGWVSVEYVNMRHLARCHAACECWLRGGRNGSFLVCIASPSACTLSEIASSLLPLVRCRSHIHPLLPAFRFRPFRHGSARAGNLCSSRGNVL